MLEIVAGIAALCASVVGAAFWVYVFFGTYWYRLRLPKV